MILYLSFVITGCNMLLVYDRQTLLNIRMAIDSAKSDIAAPVRIPLPALSYLPPHLCWHPANFPWRRRRRRKRGKWGGAAVWLKSLTQSPPMCIGLMLAYERTLFCPVSASNRWLLPVVPPFSLVPSRDLSPRIRRCGVNTFNLRPLNRSTQPEKGASLLKVALINAQSVVNKTFLLNDFFTSHALDILFITETWIKPGELSPFTELVPQDCNFLKFSSAIRLPNKDFQESQGVSGGYCYQP